MKTHIVQPHGEHEVALLEDAAKPGERIYRIQERDDQAAAINILGEELNDLLQWWSEESQRRSGPGA